jgi:hypothetical protein
LEEDIGGSEVDVGGALLILFIALKLCGVIDWSWWWVLSPAIAGAVLWTLVVGALFKWHSRSSLFYNARGRKKHSRIRKLWGRVYKLWEKQGRVYRLREKIRKKFRRKGKPECSETSGEDSETSGGS